MDRLVRTAAEQSARLSAATEKLAARRRQDLALLIRLDKSARARQVAEQRWQDRRGSAVDTHSYSIAAELARAGVV